MIDVKKVKTDIRTIGDNGYDRFLTKTDYGAQENSLGPRERFTKGQNVIGARYPKGKYPIGANEIKTDTEKRHIIVNDGDTNRAIFGRDEQGNWGLFVSKEGIDVNRGFTGEMLISSSEDPDWLSLDPEYFSYNSSTRLNVSTYTPRDIFQVGDKIRLSQTSTKYFYVMSVGTTYIDIIGGDNYTLANADVDSIDLSKEPTPTGFPTGFTHTCTVESGGTDISANFSTKQCTYFMTGTSLTVRFNLISSSLPSSLSIILASAYIPLNVAVKDARSSRPLILGGADYYGEFTGITGSHFSSKGLQINTIGGGTFTSGNFWLDDTLVTNSFSS